MPYQVENYLTITGSREDVDYILGLAELAPGGFFESICPLGDDQEAESKWGVAEDLFQPISFTRQQSGGREVLIADYTTDWQPADQVFVPLSTFLPNVTFKVAWVRPETRGSGSFTYEGGERTDWWEHDYIMLTCQQCGVQGQVTSRDSWGEKPLPANPLEEFWDSTTATYFGLCVDCVKRELSDDQPALFRYEPPSTHEEGSDHWWEDMKRLYLQKQEARNH